MGTKIAGEFKKLCTAGGMQIYFIMSEFEAAFVERTIRSLKNNFCRYMEDNGHKYIQKINQFVTKLISESSCSIDLIPKKVKNSDFLSILYSKRLREFRKPQFKNGDRVRISKVCIRKCYKPQFTQEVFEIVEISSRKPPTYTIKVEQDEIIRGKFYQKELVKV